MSNILPIIKYPDPILREKCRPVEDTTSEAFLKLVHEMLATLKAMNGLGLAAPQVGRPIQLFLWVGSSGAIECVINPRILKYDGLRFERDEGCLSIPGKQARVSRHVGCSVEYQRLRFHGLEDVRADLYNTHARVFQHEYDHLQGVLYIDHLNRSTRRALKLPQETK